MAEYMQLQRRGLPSTAKLRGSPGATMLEIVAVLVIIGLLAAMALPNIDMNPYDVAAEAETFKTSLRYAQSLGYTQANLQAGQDQVFWGINVTANSYALVRNGAAQNDINLPFTDSPTRNLPSGMSITAGTVHFDFRGRPVSAAGVVSNANTSFTITAGYKSDTTTVTQQTGFVP